MLRDHGKAPRPIHPINPTDNSSWGLYIKEVAMNRLNPCRQCHGLHKDKNNSQCRVCDKRMAYLRRLACDLEFSAAIPVDNGYPLHLPPRRS